MTMSSDDGVYLAPVGSHETNPFDRQDLYSMFDSQQKDCQLMDCRFFQSGNCVFPSPAIALKDGEFTCRSRQSNEFPNWLKQQPEEYPSLSKEIEKQRLQTYAFCDNCKTMYLDDVPGSFYPINCPKCPNVALQRGLRRSEVK